MVLQEFPQSVVEFATDPRTGIQGTEKFRSFMPNSGEVRAFCQAEMRRIAESARPIHKAPNCRYVPPARSPGSRANVFVPADNPVYAQLVAWSRGKDADECGWLMCTDRAGIFVSLNVLQNMHVVRKTAAPQVVSTEAMRDSLMRLAGQERAREIVDD